MGLDAVGDASPLGLYDLLINACNHHQMRAGFTLIELSIVLVIIGLITGGVLFGRDLIESAGIRGTVTQLNSFQSAVYTFKNKYGHIPGDMSSGMANQFGFQSRDGSAGFGDGNGRIQGQNNDTSVNVRGDCGETALFWMDLSVAGYVPIQGPMFSPTAASMSVAVVPSPGVLLPVSRLSASAFFSVYSLDFLSGDLGSPGRLMFQLFGGWQAIDSNCNSQRYFALRPNQGFAIDSKLDDGLPGTGTVRAIGPTVAAAVTTPNGAYQAVDFPSASDCAINSGYTFATSAVVCNIAIITGP